MKLKPMLTTMVILILASSQLCFASTYDGNAIIRISQDVITKNPNITIEEFDALVFKEMLKQPNKLELFKSFFNLIETVNQQTVEGEKEFRNHQAPESKRLFQRNSFEISAFRGLTYFSDRVILDLIQPARAQAGIAGFPLKLLYTLSESEFSKVQEMYQSALKRSTNDLTAINAEVLESKIVERQNQIRGYFEGRPFEGESFDKRLKMMLEQGEKEIRANFQSTHQITTTIAHTVLWNFTGVSFLWIKELRSLSPAEISLQQARFYQLLESTLGVENGFSADQLEAFQNNLQILAELKIPISGSTENKEILEAAYHSEAVRTSMQKVLEKIKTLRTEKSLMACKGAVKPTLH